MSLNYSLCYYGLWVLSNERQKKRDPPFPHLVPVLLCLVLLSSPFMFLLVGNRIHKAKSESPFGIECVLDVQQDSVRPVLLTIIITIILLLLVLVCPPHS